MAARPLTPAKACPSCRGTACETGFCQGEQQIQWIATSYLLAMTVPLSSLRTKRGSPCPPAVIANEVRQSSPPRLSLRAQRGNPWPRLSLRAQRGNPCRLNSWIATSYLLAMTIPLSSSRGLYSRHCERSAAVHGPGCHCERSAAVHGPGCHCERSAAIHGPGCHCERSAAVHAV